MEFCDSLELNHVPEIWEGYHVEFDVDDYLDIRLGDTWCRPGWKLDRAVPTEGTVDEGVCIRREGLTPLVLKAKSPIFLQHETKLLDKEVEDIEETI
jgi:hypothetical protein